jgi:hydrogenase nickel incorporation protein HypA/HybF
MEKARLVIEEVPGRGKCAACGASVPMEDFIGVCPCAAGALLDLEAGDELLIVDIELEDG